MGGDWQCPNHSCQNHRNAVFASKQNCPKCGSARPCKGNRTPQMGNMGNMQQMQQMMAMMVGNMGNLGKMGKGNPADWTCPNNECLNNRNKVFAKHDECPQCGTSKPGGNDWQ